ncbi:MAG: CpsD/CapB family tyrosine-protein kinase [Lachnospiraceae bacterium]|nr:CpsD/CapB family tyrosine-protein kinase [Lachnospiraceae bacterium]
MQAIVLKEEPLDFRTEEAYKTLRTNIEFSSSDIKNVVITSCTPNEGKSEVSFNLSKSFAQNGKKVLLVDADLRKSEMRKHYKSGKVRLGLAHYLIGKSSLNDVTCATDIPNFNIIFAGPMPPNPSELLSGKYFKQLIEETSSIYDYVIFDTPPLGSVIDSAIVAKYCDGVALVISAGDISYRFAQKVLGQLKMADCKILGCILNKINMSKKGSYGYYSRYYGKYYGYYYGSDDSTKTKKKKRHHSND